jgi:predicted DNA-binding transcriptional regulator
MDSLLHGMVPPTSDNRVHSGPGVFGILAWIGYTLATTPPPKPIEEVEKELEKELKDLESKSAEETAPNG